MAEGTLHNMYDISIGLSAIIVAGLGAMATVGAAYLNLKIKGITPEEAAKATERVGFRKHVDEATALAMDIAMEAKYQADINQAKIDEMLELNRTLVVQNEALKREVGFLRKEAQRVPALEEKVRNLTARIDRYKDQVKFLKSQLSRRRR